MQYSLIQVPKPWAVHALESILLPLQARKQVHSYKLLSIIVSSYHLRSLTGNHSTASLGQGTKPAGISNSSQPAAPSPTPPTSEHRQWSHPKIDPDSKSHLPEDTMRTPS